jgi:hypothetical protein
VVFAPDTSGEFTGELVLFSNDTTGPDTVTLQGRGISTFFPHHTGDRWVYHHLDTGGPYPWQVEVLSDTLIDGISYVRTLKRAPHEWYPQQYIDYIIDTSYNVWMIDTNYFCCDTVLYYNFLAEPNDWWIIDQWGPVFIIGVFDSTFEGTYWGMPATLTWFAHYLTEDTSDVYTWMNMKAEVLVSDFGLVRIYGEGTGGSILVGAVIDGVAWGDTTRVGITVDRPNWPGSYSLTNYPNPFNTGTTIQVALSSGGVVSLKLYDLLGREVYSFWDRQDLKPGFYYLNWSGRNRYHQRLPSGVYFLVLTGENYRRIKRPITLVK